VLAKSYKGKKKLKKKMNKESQPIKFLSEIDLLPLGRHNAVQF